jgi:hypothetical protein
MENTKYQNDMTLPIDYNKDNMSSSINKVLLKIALQTDELKNLFRNCELNPVINNVCEKNKQHLAVELLKKKGYSNGTYNLLKRFYKLDNNLSCSVRNIVILYNKKDDELLKIILESKLNSNLKNIDYIKLNIYKVIEILIDTIYKKEKYNLSFFIDFMHWDLFSTKKLPNPLALVNILKEHNNIFKNKLTIDEYVDILKINLNNRINFKDTKQLEIKIASMFEKWEHFNENPIN